MSGNIKLKKKNITKKRVIFEFSGGDLSKRKHVYKTEDISKTSKIFHNYFKKLKDDSLDLKELNLNIKYIVPQNKKSIKNLHVLNLIKYSKQNLYLSNEYFTSEDINHIALIANKISKIKKIIFFKSVLKNGWLSKLSNQYDKISSLFGHYGWFDSQIDIEKRRDKELKIFKKDIKKLKEQKLLINILRKSYKKRNSRKKFGEDFYTIKKISKKINKKIKFYSLGSSKKTNQILRNISN
jgi:hypothetical protein